MKRLLLSALPMLTALMLGAQLPTSGRLSDHIVWQLSDSVLTISGSGKMPGYNSTSISKLPWQDERLAALVKKIVVEEGITEIGSYCFGARAHSRNARNAKEHTYYNTQGATTTSLFLNIKEVELPSTLSKIGSHAFVRMPLTLIAFPEALTEIGAGAFSNTSLKMVILPPRLRRLGPEAFGGCVNLRAIDFNNLPLKLSTGLLFGAEKLRMMLHTSHIKSVAPSTFNATSFGEYSEQELLDMFHNDGLEEHMKMYMPARENFAGSDEEYADAMTQAADVFYRREAANATSMFDMDRLCLLPYNPETESFVVRTINHGHLLVHVDAAKAEEFVARWEEVSRTAQPVYRPANGRVELQSVNFFLDDLVLPAAPL